MDYFEMAVHTVNPLASLVNLKRTRCAYCGIYVPRTWSGICAHCPDTEMHKNQALDELRAISSRITSANEARNFLARTAEKSYD